MHIMNKEICLDKEPYKQSYIDGTDVAKPILMD